MLSDRQEAVASAARLTRRSLIQRAAGLSLALVGLPLLSACKRSGGADAKPGAAPSVSAVAGPKIGVLWPGPAGPSAFADALKQGLAEAGLTVGQKANLEERFADNKGDALPKLAAELVALPVDVLVASGTPASLAAKQASTSVPI